MLRLWRLNSLDSRSPTAASSVRPGGTVQRIGYAIGAAATGIAANMSGLAAGVSAEAASAAGFWVFAGFIPVLLVGLAAAWRFTRE